MEKTQSLQEHLTAMCDDLKAATKQTDAEARARINSAMQHAQMAASQLKTQAASNQTMQHLDQIAKDGKKAMAESGSDLHDRVDAMMTHAKSALEAAQKS